MQCLAYHVYAVFIITYQQRLLVLLLIRNITIFFFHIEKIIALDIKNTHSAQIVSSLNVPLVIEYQF